ncbi:hypothetical protein AAVH_16966 [Aphelenchoides avenae]|nr:hypothetical protein AAVH_16966 [Aphelenchus avenae]
MPSWLNPRYATAHDTKIIHINRGRTVRIEHGWKWPQNSLYKITKVIGKARAPIILSIPAERPQIIPLFGVGTGWCGYRSVYRIHNALLLDDGDDNAVPGSVRWIITNHLLLGFF